MTSRRCRNKTRATFVDISDGVQGALESYGRENAQLGLRERSAKPLNEAKLRQLMQQLENDINQQAGGLTQCPSVFFPRSLRCNMRDSAHVLYIWQTIKRGGDGHQADWPDVYLKTGDECISIQQVWAPEVAAPPLSGTLLWLPRASKTEHGKRARTQELCASCSDPVLCGVRALYLVYR